MRLQKVFEHRYISLIANRSNNKFYSYENNHTMEWNGLKLTSLYEDSSWNNLQMKESVMKGLLTVTSVTMILLTFWLHLKKRKKYKNENIVP